LHTPATYQSPCSSLEVLRGGGALMLVAEYPRPCILRGGRAHPRPVRRAGWAPALAVKHLRPRILAPLLLPAPPAEGTDVPCLFVAGRHDLQCRPEGARRSGLDNDTQPLPLPSFPSRQRCISDPA
jgi:hypothetical protein